MFFNDVTDAPFISFDVDKSSCADKEYEYQVCAIEEG